MTHFLIYENVVTQHIYADVFLLFYFPFLIISVHQLIEHFVFTCVFSTLCDPVHTGLTSLFLNEVNG